MNDQQPTSSQFGQPPPAYYQPQQALRAQPTHVSVTDVNMPFLSMVVFMVKWAVASIPALFLLSIIFGGIGLVMTIVLAGLGAAAAR